MHVEQLQRPGPIDDEPLVSVDVVDPKPESDELVVTVGACGVCRTDLQLCSGDLEPVVLPVVPGHQVVGRVLEVGREVEGWLPGDRVGVGWLAGTCGRCTFCRGGRENLCRSAQFTGWSRDGGFARRLSIRAGFAYALPDEMGSDAEIAPLLCGGVIGYRSLRVAGVSPGQRVGLFGFGSSARLALQVARAWGCDVFVSTRAESGRELARSMGAVWAGGHDELPPVPLDAAVTFAPTGDVVVAALRGLNRGGTVAVNAIHLDRIPEFSYDVLRSERKVTSVANSTRRDAIEFLELAAAEQISTPIEVFSLEEANGALAALAHGDLSGTAVLTTS